MTILIFDPNDFTVISGGQTGADQAALHAAKNLNIKTGGHAPKGFKTTNGNSLILKDFGLVEDISENYGRRTELNIKNSDATIRLFTKEFSPGEILTAKYCRKHNKPMFDINLDKVNDIMIQDAIKFIKLNNVLILNVAGNSEKTSPGVFELAYPIIFSVLMGTQNET